MSECLTLAVSAALLLKGHFTTLASPPVFPSGTRFIEKNSDYGVDNAHGDFDDERFELEVVEFSLKRRSHMCRRCFLCSVPHWPLEMYRNGITSACWAIVFFNLIFLFIIFMIVFFIWRFYMWNLFIHTFCSCLNCETRTAHNATPIQIQQKKPFDWQIVLMPKSRGLNSCKTKIVKTKTFTPDKRKKKKKYSAEDSFDVTSDSYMIWHRLLYSFLQTIYYWTVIL